MKRRAPAPAPGPVQPDPPVPVAPRGPRPLFAGTVVLNAEGNWSESWPLELHSIAVANTGNYWATVALDAPQATVPEHGPGVHLLEPGGRERRLPATGHVLTVYGTPGERIGLVAWTADNLRF